MKDLQQEIQREALRDLDAVKAKLYGFSTQMEDLEQGIEHNSGYAQYLERHGSELLCMFQNEEILPCHTGE